MKPWSLHSIEWHTIYSNHFINCLDLSRLWMIKLKSLRNSIGFFKCFLRWTTGCLGCCRYRRFFIHFRNYWYSLVCFSKCLFRLELFLKACDSYTINLISFLRFVPPIDIWQPHTLQTALFSHTRSTLKYFIIYLLWCTIYWLAYVTMVSSQVGT